LTKGPGSAAEAPSLSVVPGHLRSGGTRNRTGDTMIFSLGRLVFRCSWLLQDPRKQAELLPEMFLDVLRC
jgi:hypothetical protein